MVIKGIDHNVDLNDILSDVKLQGYDAKYALNVINKHKAPQPMLKVELTPQSSKVAIGKTPYIRS